MSGEPLPSARIIFRRLCAVIALISLLSGTVAFLHNDPDVGDFAQFYMGGVIAATGHWDSLYPIPKPASINNPGLPGASDMSPAYAALATARGVGDHARFISPPPVAVLLIPLAWLSFRNALAVWDILMTLCAWGVALQASAAYGKLIGRPAWGQGLLLLMIGLCPPFHDALNSGNISLLMALLISVAMRGIIARREQCTALSILTGATLKYATAPLTILAAIVSPRSLIFLLLGGAALILTTLPLTGFLPYREYFALSGVLLRPWISPLMVNSTIWWVVFNDIALKGPLPRGGTIAITAANCITILGITRLLIRRRREIRAALPMLWAAGCALIMWFMIFSPIVWAHYIGYIAVFLPWLIWEGRQSWTRAFFAFQTIWLSWFPEFLPGRRWFGPAISHMFWAQVTLLGLALWRLHDGVVGSGAAGKAFHREVAQGAKEDLILPERR